MNKFFSAFFILLFISPFSHLSAAEFNIKLRKTDINDLKQQIIPVFQQNIIYLNELRGCLEQGNHSTICLSSQKSDTNNKPLADKGYFIRLNKIIKNKMAESNASDRQLLSLLRQLVRALKQSKQCIKKSQNANELKDCIVHYDEQID